MLDWLRARWQWLLVAAAVLGAFLAGVLLRRSGTPAFDTSELEKAEATKRQAEAHAAEEILRAEADRVTKIEQLEQDHATTIKQLDEGQRQKYEELKSDPEATTNWLLDVGKKTRGGV